MVSKGIYIALGIIIIAWIIDPYLGMVLFTIFFWIGVILRIIYVFSSSFQETKDYNENQLEFKKRVKEEEAQKERKRIELKNKNEKKELISKLKSTAKLGDRSKTLIVKNNKIKINDLINSYAAMLYYIKIEETAYKIGITNHSIKIRYQQEIDMGIEIRLIAYWPMVEDAEKYERKILRMFKKYKWRGNNLLLSGNSELFYKDILNLDN